MYYRNALAAIIVYDASREKTFNAVKKWKEDLDEKVLIDGSPIPTILMGNKVTFSFISFPLSSEKKKKN